MPTEVYPAISHHEANPVPKAAYTPLPMMMGGWSSMPATGPARSIDCLPREYPYHNGGRVLPGGLRNPWAPFSGETYFPASDAAENIIQGSRSAYGVANLAGTGGSVVVPAGSLGAGLAAGGSVVSSMSRVTGRSVPSIGLGGMRNDDGWDGSVGRVHAGFSPDMTSTAGAIPRINQSSHWLQSPSGPMNHARMTPSLAPPVAYTILAPRSADYSRPRRIPSIKHKPVQKPVVECPECAECAECSSGSSLGGKSARLERSRSRGREERKDAGSPGSAYKKLSRAPLISSSLRPRDEGTGSRGDRRSSSGRSSPPKSERCVDCAA